MNEENCCEQPGDWPQHPHREALQHHEGQCSHSTRAWTNDYSTKCIVWFIFKGGAPQGDMIKGPKSTPFCQCWRIPLWPVYVMKRQREKTQGQHNLSARVASVELRQKQQQPFGCTGEFSRFSLLLRLYFTAAVRKLKIIVKSESGRQHPDQVFVLHHPQDFLVPVQNKVVIFTAAAE